MRLPSVNTLQTVFGSNAKSARELLEKKASPSDYKCVREWVDQCYCKPTYIEKLMLALDHLAGTHGVEGIFNGCAEWPDYEYLNAGDAYAPTLIYSRLKGTFRVACWGDIVERNNKYR